MDDVTKKLLCDIAEVVLNNFKGAGCYRTFAEERKKCTSPWRRPEAVVMEGLSVGDTVYSWSYDGSLVEECRVIKVVNGIPFAMNMCDYSVGMCEVFEPGFYRTAKECVQANLDELRDSERYHAEMQANIEKSLQAIADTEDEN